MKWWDWLTRPVNTTIGAIVAAGTVSTMIGIVLDRWSR